MYFLDHLDKMCELLIHSCPPVASRNRKKLVSMKFLGAVSNSLVSSYVSSSCGDVTFSAWSGCGGS